MAAGLLALAAAAVPAAEELRGLPFTRSYPLEEIGNVPRGARLSFDTFGRLALVYDGVFTVLNDTAWLPLVEGDGNVGGMTQVVRGRDGQMYYGGFGSWGRVEHARNGRLRAQPLQPATLPGWAVSNVFAEILATDHAVYFFGGNGLVRLDPRTGESELFAQPGLTRVFALGDDVFVCAHGSPVLRVAVAQGELQPVKSLRQPGFAPELATPLDERRVLLAARDGRMAVFDGETFSPWQPRNFPGFGGRVLALQRLLDGGVAFAVSGAGLYLAGAEGEVFASLTSPEYHRIDDLATAEPGVLWAITESSVEKVLYGGPVSAFGQRLGLAAYWPGVLRWNGRLLAQTSGRLLEAVPGKLGAAARFELLPRQPPGGAWAVASNGRQLLIGNPNGVFEYHPDGTTSTVLVADGVSRLVMIGDDLCIVMARQEIAALQRVGDRWQECAPRVPAIGFPSMVSIVHAARRAVWVELGGNRVARITLRDGRLTTQVFDQFPWKDSRWVNVSTVDDTVILTGPGGGRIFFDEKTEQFGDAPELRALLEQCPAWALRVTKDETGALWVTHHQAVTIFVPTGSGYRMEPQTLELLNDHYPFIQLLPGNDVWISAGRSLYRVDRSRLFQPRPSLQPRLVSISDFRTNDELYGENASALPALRVPYGRNSLNFRFFSGTYSWRRAPAYEFRLGGASERWTTLSTGSLLTLPGVREGDYELEVRLADRPSDPAARTALQFTVLPPWHRTWLAYALYALASGALVFGLVRWSGWRARRRNLQLEQLVAERTEQLTATMARLNEEARATATLAERDRLAGEIHDSIQQGLSGLILQLDATLKLGTLAPDVRSRLEVARNMVSFTRHEVQHAIWDMESPLLDGADLGDALRRIVSLISPGGATIGVAVHGDPVGLPSATKHHVLRIAQEAITNAVRHGGEARIAVRLDYAADELALEVRDDGLGFHPEEVLAKRIGHFGLRGLRGRAAKIAADLRIDSAPGRGTTVRVTVPLIRHSQPADADAARTHH